MQHSQNPFGTTSSAAAVAQASARRCSLGCGADCSAVSVKRSHCACARPLPRQRRRVFGAPASVTVTRWSLRGRFWNVVRLVGVWGGTVWSGPRDLRSVGFEWPLTTEGFDQKDATVGLRLACFEWVGGAHLKTQLCGCGARPSRNHVLATVLKRSSATGTQRS